MSVATTRTTLFYAVGTFAGLTTMAVLIWALTRTVEPAVAQPLEAPAATAAGAQEFPRIAFEDFKARLDAGAITVIDVRDYDSYVAAHVPGSLHIPLSRIEGEIPYLPKGKPIVTYCTCPAEESSGEAALILRRGGVEAYALTGGFKPWLDKGLPAATGTL